MIINNLTIPECLTRAIQDGKWPNRVTHGKLLEYFFDEVMLYGLEQMKSETAVLTACCTEGTEVYSPYYLGIASGPDVRNPKKRHLPGTIDMSKAVVIGDWGIDAPICLDYHDSIVSPSVVALRGFGAGWERVLANIDVLISMLPGA